MIERKFQLRFILSFIGILLVGTILSGGLLYIILSRNAGSGMSNNNPGLIIGICLANGVTLVLLLYPTARVTLNTSHKIGGPMRRFQNIASSIKEGNLEVNTTLRGGDQLAPMASSLGDMIEALKERIAALQKNSDVLTATINTTVRRAEQDVYLRTNIRPDLLEIKRQTDEMVKELLRYRL